MPKAVDSGQTSHAKDIAKPPDWYLDRAKECMDRAQQMTFESDPVEVKVNLSQCTYLAGELKTAVEDGRKSYYRSSSSEHQAECLETLKLLYRLAKEVESFIQDCCKEETWVQAALTSASVHVRVSSLGCYLKLCTLLLHNSNKLGAAWLEFIELERLRKAELLAVKEKALNDEVSLFSLLSSKPKGRDLEQLATILLERVKAIQAVSSTGSPQSLNLELWKEDGRRLHRIGMLGKGTSTTVYKAKWLGAVDGAEKEILVASHKFKNFKRRFEKEVFGLAQLSHPNIVTFLGYKIGQGISCSAVMELMHGDLKVLMQQKLQEDSTGVAPFSIWEACDIMLQVAEGVQYIHEKGIVHGNLKSTSILFKRSKDDDIDYVCAKVGNFGLSKEDMNEVEVDDFPEVTYRSLNRAAAGPLKYWMAPELVTLVKDGREAQKSDSESVLKYSVKSDVFSFGMFCFEILTGNMPYSIFKKEEALKMILSGLRPDLLPLQCPQDLKNLIKLCWDSQPDTRPFLPRFVKSYGISDALYFKPLLTDKTPQPALTDSPTLTLPEIVTRDFKGEYSSLKVVRQLGKGGLDTVTVYLSTWHRPEGAQVDAAQKTFIGSNDECFVNEVSILAYLKHPNVVRLLCYAADRRSCSIVMERMDADLHDLMRQRRLKRNSTPSALFSMDEAVAIMLQIAQGMEYIHRQNVVHRDLKSCNILVTTVTESGQLDVKVADFGLSVRLDSSSTPFKASVVGTVRWMAPEILRLEEGKDDTYADTSNSDPYKSDVYSFGMVCYEILAGRVPFYSTWNLTEVKNAVLDGERPSLPEWTPHILESLVEKCWQTEASSRPSFSEIVKVLKAECAPVN